MRQDTVCACSFVAPCAFTWTQIHLSVLVHVSTDSCVVISHVCRCDCGCGVCVCLLWTPGAPAGCVPAVDWPWPTVLCSPVLFYWWQPLSTHSSAALKGLSASSFRARQYNSAPVFPLYTGEKACSAVVFLFYCFKFSFICLLSLLLSSVLFSFCIVVHTLGGTVYVFHHLLSPRQKITCLDL